LSLYRGRRFSYGNRQWRTGMLPQFRVRLHFWTIHDLVFDWPFGAGSLPTACFGASDVHGYAAVDQAISDLEE
jgi:hypothetical protein